MVKKRKIPASKKHGIRDPIRHQERELKKIKDKINNPPEKDGDQKISFKLNQFIKLKNDAKLGVKIKRNIGREDKPKTNAKNTKQPTNKFKPIKQLPNETDISYLKRVNRLTTDSLNEAQYENKYGVNVIRDTKTGKITIQKRPMNEIDEIIKNKNKRGKKSAQTIKRKIDPKVVKDLLKQAIKEDQDENKGTEVEEFKKDVVKFGEIVHGPPAALTLPRKAQKNETVPRPGMKNNLLLKSLLGKDEKKEIPSVSKTKKTIPKKGVSKADLKGKRKDLPIATRAMLEDEQSKFIEMYRQLKKNR